jgi:hypothetical protein
VATGATGHPLLSGGLVSANDGPAGSQPGVGPIRNWVRRAGLCLALAALGWVIWIISTNARQLGQALSSRDLLLAIALGVCAYVLLSALLALAWWWLAGVYGQRPHPLAAYAVWARTQIAKYLPGNVFHIVARQVLGRRLGLTHAALAASAVIEMASLLLAAGIIGVGGALATRSTAAAAVSLPVLAAAIVGGLLAWPAIDKVLRRIPRVADYMHPLPRLSLARSVRLLAPSLMLHAGFLLGSGVVLLALLHAGWPQATLDWPRVIWVYALAWAAGTVTIGAPAGMGVREAILALALAESLGQAEAATLALTLRLVTLIGDLATGGLGWVVRIPSEPTNTPPTPQNGQRAAES